MVSIDDKVAGLRFVEPSSFPDGDYDHKRSLLNKYHDPLVRNPLTGVLKHKGSAWPTYLPLEDIGASVDVYA